MITIDGVDTTGGQVIAIVTAVLVALSGVGYLAHLKPFVAGAEAVKVTRQGMNVLGLLKIAGSLGIVVGLIWLPVLGVIASACLVLYFIGAIVAHLRHGQASTLAAPTVFLCLSIATLVAFLRW